MARKADGSGTAGTDQAPARSSYRNPLRGVRGLTAERVDMGVDYSGTGPVYALGPGVITAAGHAWQGAVGAPVPGTWITERLTQGPLAGHQVYVAEDIYDIQVQPGEHVTSATPLGTLRGGLETGFAAPGAAGRSGETAAAAAGQQASGGDPGARPTAYGAAYSQALDKLGAPAGVMTSADVSGGVPSWLKDALNLVVPGANLGNDASGAAGGLGAIGGVLSWLQQLDTAITWLVNPSNWIRIISGVTGGIMVIGGIFVLSGLQARTSEAVPFIGGSVGAVQSSVRLPVGILLVGAGGVLLFIAFHNLPGGVSDLSSLLAYEQDRLQSGVATGKAAA